MSAPAVLDHGQVQFLQGNRQSQQRSRTNSYAGPLTAHQVRVGWVDLGGWYEGRQPLVWRGGSQRLRLAGCRPSHVPQPTHGR